MTNKEKSMIPYEDSLLELIQDAVCDWVELNEEEEECKNFSVVIKIRVDDATVFKPKVIKYD